VEIFVAIQDRNESIVENKLIQLWVTNVTENPHQVKNEHYTLGQYDAAI
jgi:hypothetical protein